jgi:hypothetical protein
MGRARYPDTQRPNQTGQIKSGCFTFNGEVGGKNHFLDRAILQPFNQIEHMQLIRANAVKRLQRSMQDMITTAEGSTPLNRYQILRFLDDTDD